MNTDCVSDSEVRIYKLLLFLQGNANRVVDKKERKEPPKYPCHMCDIPIMFALTALRRHLARYNNLSQ